MKNIDTISKELLDVLKSSCSTYEFKPQTGKECIKSFKESVHSTLLKSYPGLLELVKFDGKVIRIDSDFLDENSWILNVLPYVIRVDFGEYDLYSGDTYVGRISWTEVDDPNNIGYTGNIKFAEPTQRVSIDIDIWG